jgi:hypothetical protein
VSQRSDAKNRGWHAWRTTCSKSFERSTETSLAATIRDPVTAYVKVP